MAKRLSKILLSLALLPLFATKAEGQTHLVSQTEIVGDFDGNNYTLLTNLKGYTFIRTDEDGRLVWTQKLKTFNLDSVEFVSHQNRFIVAGITSYNKKTNRIKGDPGDYEYWLIPAYEITDGFFCLPNPTLGKTTVIVNIDSEIEIFRLYDINGRLIYSIPNIQDNQFDIDLGNYKSGVYFLESANKDGMSVQTIKIIKQ